MPVRLTKPQPNPATQVRVSEVMQALDQICRTMAPVVQRAGEELARSLRTVGQRRA